MPTPTKGARLGGSPAHQRLILANLASQLFEHGRITTTEAKAKRLRPVAEKLITKAKRGDLHARRQVLATIRDQGVVHTLFTEIAPTFAEREGGYLRITKVGPRKGDRAPMAVIELVTESVEESRKANDAKAPSARRDTAAAPAAGTTDLADTEPEETEAEATEATEAEATADEATEGEVAETSEQDTAEATETVEADDAEARRAAPAEATEGTDSEPARAEAETDETEQKPEA